jgi:membrane protease YdiL (CAAX protease family)/LysM repeat protein
VLVEPRAGQALHLLVLFILLIHASLTWQRPIHRFLLSLAFVPLIRIISLSLPLAGIPLIFWYLIVSIPLFAAAFVSLRLLRLRPRSLSLLVLNYTWDRLLIAATILLVSTGYLEELVFRGIMQRMSVERLGPVFGVIYVALIFAVLHIGYQSLLDVIFVLVIGLLFGWFAAWSGGLLGVTLSHSLTNIVLFLVIPYWIYTSGKPGPPALAELISQGRSSVSIPGQSGENPSSIILEPTPYNIDPVGLVVLDPPATPSIPPSPEQDTAPTGPAVVTGSDPDTPVAPGKDNANHEADTSPKLETPSTAAELDCGFLPAGWAPYTVRPGDTLWELSTTTGASIQEIVQASCLDANTLHVGDHLYLPMVPATRSVCHPRSDWKPYTVQHGDTLFSLARRHGATVYEVMQANCLTNDNIYQGSRLLVPSVVVIADPGPPADAASMPPTVTPASSRQAIWRITSPTAGSMVSGIVPILGTADFNPMEVQFYKIELRAADSQDQQWVTLGSVHAPPVVNGQLETLYASGLPTGVYLLRLVLITWDGNHVGQPFTIPVAIE